MIILDPSTATDPPKYDLKNEIRKGKYDFSMAGGPEYKYCQGCGLETVRISIPLHFSPKTGKIVYDHRSICPKAHSVWEWIKSAYHTDKSEDCE